MFIFVVGNFHLVDDIANIIMSQESLLTGREVEGSLCEENCLCQEAGTVCFPSLNSHFRLPLAGITSGALGRCFGIGCHEGEEQ